ncbi:MAG: hypothetical protein SP1CHLAM54_18100 [Chlamydiia bacterium]|nr:hypothetical protein [Chlamydiia bacterium]MCH9616696.1 hypothetical protein [Chlamydiia bacterium]MCH9629427.1 hypothetical protein [Chlamydiia bacterium]
MDILHKGRVAHIRSNEELTATYDVIFLEHKVVPNLDPVAALKLLSETEKLKTFAEKKAPELGKRIYTDGDLEFLEKELNEEQKKDLPGFLEELRDAGQITKAQFERFYIKSSQLQEETPKNVCETFEKAALHLAPGGIFAWLGRDPAPYYEDAKFFQTVLSSADLEFCAEAEGNIYKMWIRKNSPP